MTRIMISTWPIKLGWLRYFCPTHLIPCLTDSVNGTKCVDHSSQTKVKYLRTRSPPGKRDEMYIWRRVLVRYVQVVKRNPVLFVQSPFLERTIGSELQNFSVLFFLNLLIIHDRTWLFSDGLPLGEKETSCPKHTFNQLHYNFERQTVQVYLYALTHTLTDQK